MKNILFAQSGGPTSVINASCYGIIKEAKKHGLGIYAARHGIEGVLIDDIIDLTDIHENALEILRYSPSSAFGSCRHKLVEEDFENILETFKKYDIDGFFYIGGNDSMDSANRLSSYCKDKGLDIKVLGIPKTIDNDLLKTHFCPGFGSAAKYIATSVREMTLDANVYDKNIITIVEVMGRDSGFLAAASALAKDDVIDAPHLIYLPENTFRDEDFLADVEHHYRENGKVFIVVSEGIKDEKGQYVFLKDKKSDAFGNIQMGGVGNYLGHLVKSHIEKRVKIIEFNILQRCAAHISSKVDNDAAVLVGRAGVSYALEGITDMMVILVKDGSSFTTSVVPLEDVAINVKTMPREWIDEDKRWVKSQALDYMLPLIQGEVSPVYERGLPRYCSFI